MAEEESAVAEEPRSVKPRKRKLKSGHAVRTLSEVKDDLTQTAARSKAARAKGRPREECYGDEPIRGGGVGSVEPPAGPRVIKPKRQRAVDVGRRDSKVDVAASASRAVP